MITLVLSYCSPLTGATLFVAKILLTNTNKTQAVEISRSIRNAWGKRVRSGNTPGMTDEEIQGEFLKTAQETLNAIEVEYGSITIGDTLIVKL